VLSRSEDLLISAVVRNPRGPGRGVTAAAKLGVNANLFLQRKAQWMWLQEHRGASKETFKARFPDFKVFTVDPEELNLIVAQAQRTKADYDLGKMFERAQRRLGRMEPVQLATELESEIRTILQGYSHGEDVDIIGNWQLTYNHVKHAHDQVAAGESIGYPFGIPTLDKLTGGMQAPDLITIVARQGEFKTWMSLYFATKAAVNGAKVLYASLEMSPAQIGLRVQTLLNNMLASSMKDEFKDRFSNMGMMMGAVDLRKYRRFLIRAKKHMKSDFITPAAQGGFSMATMVAKCEQHQPDIAFFDYFGLGVGNDMVRGGDNWVQAVQTSRMAKHNIARQFNIPFVLNAQANRKGVDAQDAPELDHISLTDALGADSDQVLSLRYRAGDLKMVVKKNRRGRTGDTIKFDLDIDNGVIEEISTVRQRRRPQHSDEESDD
jgi:replicative DNA helicase